jgi:hypothetical protein
VHFSIAPIFRTVMYSYTLPFQLQSPSPQEPHHQALISVLKRKMAQEKSQPLQKMQPPSAEEQQRIAAEKERALSILDAKRAEVNRMMANILEAEEEMKERHRQQQEMKNKAKLAVEVKMKPARKLEKNWHNYGGGTTK